MLAHPEFSSKINLEQFRLVCGHIRFVCTNFVHAVTPPTREGNCKIKYWRKDAWHSSHNWQVKVTFYTLGRTCFILLHAVNPRKDFHWVSDDWVLCILTARLAKANSEMIMVALQNFATRLQVNPVFYLTLSFDVVITQDIYKKVDWKIYLLFARRKLVIFYILFFVLFSVHLLQ